MEQEVLELNSRERDRLKVLHEAEKEHILQREAAERLGLSERQLRWLLARVREEGDRGLAAEVDVAQILRRQRGTKTHVLASDDFHGAPLHLLP